MSYLVIHGLEVETPDLKAIAKLCGASRIENVGNNAFRLHDYKTQDGVAEYCAKAKLDFAFVPVARKLSDFGLVAMDMDSTLITIECIDEIADIRGIKPQVAAITASAMRGEIEYHESLRRRLALLEGMDESALARVYDERLKLSPGAERMLARLRSLGILLHRAAQGTPFARLHPVERPRIQKRQTHRQSRRPHRRRANQSRETARTARRTAAVARPSYRLRRRRQRPRDDGGGRRFYRVPRQAGGAGKSDLLF